MTTDESRVAELRALVADDLTPYYDTHFNLLRWIQGHPGESVKKIAPRLRHHLLFRKSAWNLDTVLETKKHGYHPLHQYWPSTRCGMSGVVPRCVVHVEQAGYMDYFGMLDAFSFTEAVKGLLHNSEQMLGEVMHIEKETGEQASIIYIFDAGDIVFSKKLVELMVGPLMALADRMFTHYPEIMKYMVVVNVPTFANVLWNMCKPLLPVRAKERIHLLSSSNWRNEIHSLVDPSVCPVFWNNDKHSEFKLPLERPPKVPSNAIMTPEKLDKLEKLYVKARKVHWLEYKLEKGDTFCFAITSDSTFGFGIVHAAKGEENDIHAMRQLFPVFTWLPGPLKVPIEDTVIAPESGLYKVWISNSRSWLSSLTVHYCFKVVKAK